jgi:hypothetical protein
MNRSACLRTSAACAAFAAVLVACTAGEASPSTGTYTVQFPSTAAAVATDSVLVLVFDVLPAERATTCQNLISARKRREPLRPAVTNPQVNICEMNKGARPISVPYGEKAVLAIGVRKGNDYLIGCTLQTFGEGDAPAAIPLALIDMGQGVPETPCNSLSDFCNRVCQST